MLTFNKNMVGMLAGCILVATGAMADIHEYRDRMLGDQAFNDRDYAQAVKFYQRYLNDAASNDSAWIDASRRLVSAMLRDNRAGDALAVFRRLKERLGKNMDMDDRLVEIEVLAASNNLDEARNQVEEFLHGLDQDSEAYVRALDLLGYVLLQKKCWREAANVYSLLERNELAGPWEYKAFCKRVYAMIMAGDYKEASKALTLNLRYVNSPDKNEARGLSLLLLLKENRTKEFSDIYNGLRDSLTVTPDAVCFEALMLAHDKFLAAGDAANATFYLSEAFGFSPDKERRKSVLRLLINEYVKNGKPDAAADICEKYLNFYHNEPEAADIRMELATLLVWQKKFDSAVNVYSQVMNNSALGLKIRLAAAKNVGAILADHKKYDEADKAFEFICRNGATKDDQAEGMVLLGQSYYNQELYQRAILILREAADISPLWQPVALHWIMRSHIQLKEYDAAKNLIAVMAKMSCDRSLEAENSYYLGYILDKTGRIKEACDAYEQYALRFPEVPHAAQALFRAGDLAMENKHFMAAARIFSVFAERYRKHALEPAALYKQVFALFCAGKGAEATLIVDSMDRMFPDNQYTVAADFWEVDYYRDMGDLNKTEVLLEDMSRRFSGNEDVIRKVLYDRAYIAFKRDDATRAGTLLEELFKKELDAASSARACFLQGELLSDRGDYAAAIKSYLSCLKNLPGYEMETACYGRLGDCYYSIYTRNKDDAGLDKAIEQYNILVGRKKLDDAIRQQTLFKLGKCYEQKKEDAKALEYYKELIFNYKVSSTSGGYTRPVWLVKAAYAAIDIYLAQDTPEAAAAAIHVYEVLQGLNLNIGEDYRKMIDRIKRKFKL